MLREPDLYIGMDFPRVPILGKSGIASVPSAHPVNARWPVATQSEEVNLNSSKPFRSQAGWLVGLPVAVTAA